MGLETALIARSIAGTKFWELYEELVYTNDTLLPCRKIKIAVPPGYKTDWSSVPWGLRNISHPSEFPEAAAIHDYIYTDLCVAFTKKQADTIFKDILLELGCGAIRAQIMYVGVRVGGKGGWPKNDDDYNEWWF